MVPVWSAASDSQRCAKPTHFRPPWGMRIAVDVTPLAHPNSGIGHFVSVLVPALEAADNDVTRFVMSGSASAGRTQFPGAHVVRIPGATAAFRWWGRFGGRPPSIFDDVAIVHGTNYVTPPPGRAACVISVHDASPWLAPRWGEAPNRTITRLVERRIKQGAWVHTLTNATAATLADILDTDRIRVAPIPPATVADASRDDLPVRLAGRPYVLCLGAEKRRKRLDAVIRGFVDAAQNDADIALVLAGAEGDGSSDVVQALDEVGQVRSRIYRLGPVTEAKRNALVTFARALCYVSHHEGEGLPVLEAQGLGIPVVIGDDSAVAETSGGAAISCDPADVSSIGGALRTAVNDEAKRAELKASGRQNAARFTPERFLDDMTDIYRQATNR